MFYRLREPWAFRGWKRLPFAIQAQAGEASLEEPFLYDKETFLELLCCNGEENVDISSFSIAGNKIIGELTEQGIIEVSEDPLPPLSSYQHYHIYPSRKKSSVHWSITGKCNFNCRHCLVSAPTAHHPQLPLKDCLHIIDEIDKCGIKRIDITGGEPLVRNDFETIVEEISKRGINIGYLFTNASLLTEKVLDMLERYGQHPIFQLSFDGLGHHDWLRGVPGSEKLADEAFRLLKARKCFVVAAMCIHKENRDSLRDTVNYLASMNVVKLRVNSPQNLGLWRDIEGEFALTQEEVWETYRDYIPHFFEDGMPIGISLDGYFSCERGKTDYDVKYIKNSDKERDYTSFPYCESTMYNMYIGPDGKIAPCMGFSDSGLKEKFPSVLEHPLGELTLGGNYYDIVETKIRDLMANNDECAKCEFISQCCGGCMLEGITDDGDYLVPDRRSCYFFRNVGEQAVREVADTAIRSFGK